MSYKKIYNQNNHFILNDPYNIYSYNKNILNIPINNKQQYHSLFNVDIEEDYIPLNYNFIKQQRLKEDRQLISSQISQQQILLIRKMLEERQMQEDAKSSINKSLKLDNLTRIKHIERQINDLNQNIINQIQ
jgi:hypothetical protein